MKVAIPNIAEYDVKIMEVDVGMRYVGYDDDDDVTPDLPFLKEDRRWVVDIDIESGKIVGWEGATEKDWKIFTKVCDDGMYFLKDENSTVVATRPYGSYVQNSINGGDSDYVDITVGKDGTIKDWKFDASDFVDEAFSNVEKTIK